MKKVIAVLLALMLLLTFAGCGDSSGVKESDSSDVNIGEKTEQTEKRTGYFVTEICLLQETTRTLPGMRR